MGSGEVVRQAVQAPDEASDVPLDHIVDVSEDDLNVVRYLIAVWADDELLNALGRVDKHADSVTVSFDMSVDWQLVELVLTWGVGYVATSDPGTLRSKSRRPPGSHAQGRPAQWFEPACGRVPSVENNQGISPVTGQDESNADRQRQFRYRTRAMIWFSDRRRFAEDAHRTEVTVSGSAVAQPGPEKRAREVSPGAFRWPVTENE